MNNLLIRTYEIPIKGIKKKVIYHFSDVHLTQFDELSDEEEIAEAKKKTDKWITTRREFALQYGEPCEKEQMQSALVQFEKLLKASEDGDLLLLAGDIMDYVNGANVRYVEKMLGEISVPYMYVPGNHERAENLPDSDIFKTVKQPIQKIENEDFVILGIDTSNHKITKEQNIQVKEILKAGKPVIILTHIPFMTEENEEILRECDKYFYLNNSDAPAENFEFFSIIKENSENLIGVFTGHLHFGNVSEISNGKMQYVSSQGITGTINKYIIGL